MSMYLDDIAVREFVVAQEGYDREEVRAFLEVVGRNHRAMQQELASLRERRSSGDDVGGEIAALLQGARETAEQTLRQAKEEAEAIRAEAEADADVLRQATIDASDRAREEADLYAFETKAKADREARDKLRETNERVAALMSGATKVRDRLFGIDTILVGVRNEITLAANSLDATEEELQKAQMPPPPPPPAVIDLTDSSSNGSRIATEA